LRNTLAADFGIAPAITLFHVFMFCSW